MVTKNAVFMRSVVFRKRLDNIKTKEELCKSIKLQNFRMIQCEQSMILQEQESH